MRYRAMDSNGDYVFGQRSPKFYVDEPRAVAQAIDTRLRLMTGEWFLDTTEGTPYAEQIVGTQTLYTRDPAIKSRIINTPGVEELVAYASSTDQDRKLQVYARVSTVYGEVLVSSAI